MRVKTKGKDENSKRQYYREYMREKRAEKKARGLCVACGQPTNGRTLCSKCLEIQRIRQREYSKRKGHE